MVEGDVGTEDADVDADFCAFVEGRQASLRHAAWLLTGDLGLAEDLVQVALVKSWPHWPKLVGSGGAEAYVRRVLVTTYSSWWRRKWRREVPGHVPEVAGRDEVSQVAISTSVRSALLALPPRQRAAVVLRYFEDLTEAQTAEALRCSVGNVKSQTSRALDKLRAFPGLAELLVEGAEP
jgi:RNA polymerase sigma-70 factor (sigma-E family)